MWGCYWGWCSLLPIAAQRGLYPCHFLLTHKSLTLKREVREVLTENILISWLVTLCFLPFLLFRAQGVILRILRRPRITLEEPPMILTPCWPRNFFAFHCPSIWSCLLEYEEDLFSVHPFHSKDETREAGLVASHPLATIWTMSSPYCLEHGRLNLSRKMVALHPSRFPTLGKGRSLLFLFADF